MVREPKKYTVIDRDVRTKFSTDDPKEAYEETLQIEEEGHDYAIKNNEIDEYVSRLSVRLAY